MIDTDAVLTRILQWADKEEPIRALILVGSRVQEEPADELADFDMAVFARSCQPYLQEDRWLASIGPLWVCVRDHYEVGGESVATRLAIFEGGLKVDFSFHELSLLPKVRWIGGYKVLLDKDGEATRQARSAKEESPRPSEPGFVRLVDEFWFEAYHVAKYLTREELWLAKTRDWATKERLLRMLEWHHGSRSGWEGHAASEGRRLKDWADPEIWSALSETFARLDAPESWRALSATTGLFRRLAQETAERLGLAYPQQVDAAISGFIAGLRPR